MMVAWQRHDRVTWVFDYLVYKTTDIQKDVERLSAGEEDARERLIHSATQRLERMVRIFKRRFPRVSRWEQTDDVFQNAIIRLHRALASVKPRDAQHFLRLAARHIRFELIDLARKHQGPLGLDRRHETGVLQANQNQRTSAAPGWQPAAPGSDPQMLARWTEIHEAVDRLPESEREVCELFWYQELPQKEIADMLGISVETVKRRWRAARLRLAQLLQEDKESV